MRAPGQRSPLCGDLLSFDVVVPRGGVTSGSGNKEGDLGLAWGM